MKKNLITISILALFSAGCAVEVTPTIPEAVVETRPAVPYPNAVWVTGEYRWGGAGYVVVPGHYEQPRGTWISGHWKRTRRGYHWVRGYWH